MMRLIAAGQLSGQLGRPEFKRRWSGLSWPVLEQAALRDVIPSFRAE